MAQSKYEIPVAAYLTDSSKPFTSIITDEKPKEITDGSKSPITIDTSTRRQYESLKLKKGKDILKNYKRHLNDLGKGNCAYALIFSTGKLNIEDYFEENNDNEIIFRESYGDSIEDTLNYIESDYKKLTEKVAEKEKVAKNNSNSNEKDLRVAFVYSHQGQYRAFEFKRNEMKIDSKLCDLIKNDTNRNKYDVVASNIKCMDAHLKNDADVQYRDANKFFEMNSRDKDYTPKNTDKYLITN